MALFEPPAGMMPDAGAGVLAPVAPVQPIQPIQGPQDVTAVMNALAAARLKNTKLQQALLRAQVLREAQQQGLGPGGAQQGQGPGGWAVTAADAFNRMMDRNRQQDAMAQIQAALGEQSPAVTALQQESLKAQPGKYKLRDMENFVPQGTPLGF